MVHSPRNWIKCPSWVFTHWSNQDSCGYRWLYWPVTWFTAAVKVYALHPMNIQTLPGCLHRTWEAFPPAAHENLSTWQKALWWMTGPSRRLYTGALNYVLHSQIIVTEAFTGTTPTGLSHQQVRLLQHLCNNKQRQNDNNEDRWWRKLHPKAVRRKQNTFRRRSFVCHLPVSCFHVHN